MKMLFKVIAIIVAVVIVVPILILGYLGFVPGISDLFGSNKPRDLGVTYSNTDVQSVYAKSATTYAALPSSTPADKSIIYSGSTSVKQSFTANELTARLDTDKWKYQPVHDAQIKINPDGTVEGSGMLKLSNVDAFASTHGLDAAAIKAALGTAAAVGSDVPFYAKGTGSVVNNQVTANIQQLEIGRLPIPTFSNDQASGYIQTIFSNVNGLNIKSATFTDGKLNFDGTMPKDIASVQS